MHKLQIHLHNQELVKAQANQTEASAREFLSLIEQDPDTPPGVLAQARSAVEMAALARAAAGTLAVKIQQAMEALGAPLAQPGYYPHASGWSVHEA